MSALSAKPGSLQQHTDLELRLSFQDFRELAMAFWFRGMISPKATQSMAFRASLRPAILDPGKQNGLMTRVLGGNPPGRASWWKAGNGTAAASAQRARADQGRKAEKEVSFAKPSRPPFTSTHTLGPSRLCFAWLPTPTYP